MAILWTETARDQLADLYVACPIDEREELIQIIGIVEQLLLKNGNIIGESRGGSHRVFFAPRITVFFSLLNTGDIEIFRVRSSRKTGFD